MRQSEPSRPIDGDFGQKAYREPGTANDGRGVIRYGSQWASVEQEMEYRQAVRMNPKGPDERGFAYVVRIAEIVNGRLEDPKRAMPQSRIPGEEG